VALEDAGQDLHAIGFVARCREPALAGASTVEVSLDLLEADRKARGAAVDDDTDTTPV